jgi:hypothetical protein
VADVFSGFCKKNRPEIIATMLFLALNIVCLSLYKWHVPSSYNTSEKIEAFNAVRGKDCEVYIAEDWQALYYFQELQYANSYVFFQIPRDKLAEYGNKDEGGIIIK